MTDEQIELLHKHPEVSDARQKFLVRLAKGVRERSQEIIDEAHNVWKPEYLRLFEARREWVIANPPEPKARPILAFSGFAKRA